MLNLLLLLACTVGAVALARRLHVPSMLAYLVVGALLGPHGFHRLVESELISELAEFGIVFLMFSIGLEFSMRKLRAMRKMVFGMGSAQMALTALGTALVTWIGYGQGWRSGLAMGLAVAMSSTAIVARMLSERFELQSRSGRQTMGVLLFQDLAVVPCLILLPALASGDDDLLPSLALAGLQAMLVLLLLVWLGQHTLGRFMHHMAQHRSDELLVLSTLLLVMGLSALTAYSGLSMALGAFVGGMLLSETIYRHQVEADIRPFRDIFLGLFFVTVGMMLDLKYVFAHLPLLALAVTLLVGGKALVMVLVTRATKTPWAVGLRTAAQLAQAGEFGLVLVQLSYELGLIGLDVFQISLSAMLLSMFLAPVLIRRAATLSSDLGRGDWAHSVTVLQDLAVHSMDLKEHIILCGYGRTGEGVARLLQAEGLPFITLDTDPQRIAAARAHGHNAVFGNAERTEVLVAAGLARARTLVLTYAHVHSSERVVQLARAQRADMPIVVRCTDEQDVGRLKQAGATEVIPELHEASLIMATEALVQSGVPVERALGHVRQARAQRYETMRRYYKP